MISRIFYTFLMLTLTPISLLLIFKPDFWQSLYSKLYFSRLEAKESKIIKILAQSLLSMSSSEASFIIHRAIGILLGLVVLYIFFMKLKIVSPI